MRFAAHTSEAIDIITSAEQTILSIYPSFGSRRICQLVHLSNPPRGNPLGVIENLHLISHARYARIYRIQFCSTTKLHLSALNDHLFRARLLGSLAAAIHLSRPHLSQLF